METVLTPNSVFSTGSDVSVRQPTEHEPSSQNGGISIQNGDAKIQQQANRPAMKILDTTQLVRVKLIHENWTFIESKKSPLLSTLSRYSTKSFVPPSSSPHIVGMTSPVVDYGASKNRNDRSDNKPAAARVVGVETFGRPPERKYRNTNATSEKPWNFDDDNLATFRTLPSAVDDVIDEYREQALKRLHNGSGTTHGGQKTGGRNRSKKYNDEETNVDDEDRVAGGDSADDDDDVELYQRSNGSQKDNRHKRFDRLSDNGHTNNGGMYDNVSDDDKDVDDFGFIEDNEDFDVDMMSSMARLKQRRKQLPSRLDDTQQQQKLFGKPGRTNGDVIDVDVDALCVTPRVDDDEDDNITLLSRWAESRDSKPITTVPSYDNLVSLQRDAGRPLLMYIPEPDVQGKPSVGDVDVSELSDLSDPETPSDFDDEATNKPIIQRMDSCVQTEIPPMLPPVVPVFAGVPVSSTTSGQRARDNGTQPPQEERLDTAQVLSRKPANVTLSEGEVAEISCQLTGPEPYDVYWFRDTSDLVNLDDDDRCELNRHGNTFSVKLYNSTRRDSGYYLCVAVNGEGQSTYRFLVVVTANVNVNRRQGPDFKHRPETNITIFADQTTELDCHVTGNPEPQVIWYLDGRKIKDGNEFSIDRSKSSGYHRLVIRNAGSQLCHGAQQFQVVARNVIGEISSTCKIESESRNITGVSVADMASSGATCADNQVESKKDDSTLYPDSDQLMKIAELAAANLTSGKVPATAPAVQRQQSLLTEFTRSLDLGDPLLPLHEEPGPRMPSSPRVTYLGNSSSYDSNEDDLVDLELTFQQFNALFEAGIISTTETNMSRVKRADLNSIKEFLDRAIPENESQVVPSGGEHKEYSLTVDCGLKRIDSKRYRKDYFINRDSVDGAHAGGGGGGGGGGAGATQSADRRPSFDFESYGRRASRDSRLDRLSSSSDTHSNEHDGTLTSLAANYDVIDQHDCQTSSLDVNHNVVFPAMPFDDDSKRSFDEMTASRAPVEGDTDELERCWTHDVEEPTGHDDHVQSRDGEEGHVTSLNVILSRPEERTAEDNRGITLSTEDDNSVGQHGMESRDDQDNKGKLEPVKDNGDKLHGGTIDIVDNGRVVLPSVKEMSAKFKDETNFTRVHSLTGRELPLSLREKTPKPKPKLTPVVAPNPAQPSPRGRIQSETTATKTSAIKSDEGNPASKPLKIGTVLGRSQSTSDAIKPPSKTFTPTTPTTPSTTLAIKSDEGNPASKPLKIGTVLGRSQSTSDAIKPPSKTFTPTTPTTPSTTLAIKSDEGNPASKPLKIGTVLGRSQSTSDAIKPPSKTFTPTTPTTPSTTLARTMFWQQRISSGQTSDSGDVINSFPPLPGDLFKKSDV